MMDFYSLLDDVLDLLRRRGRVTYRALKRQFHLDDDVLDDLKEELIKAQRVAVDENGDVLVWVGDVGSTPAPTPASPQSVQMPSAEVDRAAPIESPPAAPHAPEAERRQLTVMFCDLVDSTALASQLDPEDWREVVRSYQETCAKVIAGYEGHIAQYLGDGLLIYFGYPRAHEDDAQRAVRAGLGIVEAMGQLNTRLAQERGVQLAARLGIHTGLVVVGEIGGGTRQEQLAMGETPNLAARLQGLAAPNTVVISAATSRLVHGYFTCQDLGTHALKGLETLVHVSQVLGESVGQSRLDVAGATGLTPLVGRETEVTLLRERWAQSTEGLGQVVVLSGEAGIGKSRLVHELTEWVVDKHTPWLKLRCSPYHTNSALYPVIEHMQRLLHWHRDTTPDARLATMEQALETAHLPLAEVVPLVAALLSLPVPAHYPPLTLSPQRQKQQTLEALVSWILAEAAQQPVLTIWEDLHWADPSTLELLALLLDQVPTARVLLVLTCRPEFRPPWAPRSYVTPLTLTRLLRPQVEELVLRLTGGKPLPAAVLRQIVEKTDGIPLFVEELVKTVLEAGLVREDAERYVLSGPLPPLAIPITLQDALMARLDRLALVKAVAQLGAVLGREFSYALLRAVAPLDEATLQNSLAQLVEAELLYQRGMPPQATYLFKHALVQDAAYHSLLRSTRQQHHQRIAQVLEQQFPDTVERQPELLAQHYTEAGLHTQAVGYWQQAGQRASERSACVEAIAHLTRGLEVLTALPDTPQRAQQELDLQMTLAPVLMAIKGHASQEMESAYAKAYALCQRLGNSPQVFPALFGLWRFYNVRAEFKTSHELATQCLTLAQMQHDPAHLLVANYAIGHTLFWYGEFTSARAHLKQALTLYDPQQDRSMMMRYGVSPRMQSLCFAAWTLWMLGYPDQALQWSQEAITLAYELAHPFSLAFTLNFTACILQACRNAQAVQERAEAVITLTKEQEFSHWFAHGMIMQGWAQAAQGHGDAGRVQMSQGLTAYQATGARLLVPYVRVLIAEVYGNLEQEDAGLAMLAEALEAAADTGGHFCEAELHRLKGKLLLSQSSVDSSEAETCFQHALAIAHHQQAKSWELRAATSLARLWQRQGKQAQAYDLLAPIYSWFTEGFATPDLQEAKALLDEWS